MAASALSYHRSGFRRAMVYPARISARTARSPALRIMKGTLVVLLMSATGACRVMPQSEPFRTLHGLTVADFLNVETVSDAAVDNDGALVAVVVQRARKPGEPIRERAYYGNVRADVRVVSAASGRVVMHTEGRAEHAGYWNPVWSPRGTRLAMLRLRGDTLSVCAWHRITHVTVCREDGRSGDYLTHLSVGAVSGTSSTSDRTFLWLSDSILVVALLPRGHFDLQVVRSHFLADSVSISWAQQGRGAESTARALETPQPQTTPTAFVEVYFWNVARGKMLEAFQLPYFSQGARSVVFSADHKWAAVLPELNYSAPSSTAPFGIHNRTHARLGVVDLTHGATLRWATKRPYTLFGGWVAAGDRFAVMVKKSDDENVPRGTRRFVIDPRTLTVDSVARDSGTDSSLRWERRAVPVSTGQETLALAGHVLARAPNGAFSIVRRVGATGTSVWLVPSGAEVPRVLLCVNEQLADVTNSTRMVISYTALDGTFQRGVVLLPPGFKRGVPSPLIAWLYPGSVYTDTLDAEWLRSEDDQFFLNPNVLSGHGYAVLFPSMPLGSDTTVGDPCLSVLNSVAPAIDTLIARDVADSTRLGVIGHSFGGYATNCIIAQSHRFRAAVSSAPVSDMTSFALELQPNSRYTDSPDLALRWVETAGQMGGPPWHDAARYIRNSPIYHADSVHTPVLITTGDNDFIGQAEEWFTALHRAGKRARLVRYWGEGHLLNSPANVKRNWQEVLLWFDTYLYPERVGPPRGEGSEEP